MAICFCNALAGWLVYAGAAVLCASRAETQSPQNHPRPAASPNLIHSSKFVCSGVKWQAGQSYSWLDKDRVLVWSHKSDKPFVYAVDIRSSKRNELKGISRILDENKDIWEHTARVSPDGRYIMWVTGEVKQATGWILTAIDGSQIRRVTDVRYPVDSTVWQADSKGWFYIGAESDGVVARHFDLSTLEGPRDVPLPTIDKTWEGPGFKY